MARAAKQGKRAAAQPKELAASVREQQTETPDGLVAWRRGVIVANAGGDPLKTLLLFREAVARLPDDPKPLYNLAWALDEIGDTQGARSALEAAVKLKPDFAEAYCELGRLRVSEPGKLNIAETISVFVKAIIFSQTVEERKELAITVNDLLGIVKYLEDSSKPTEIIPQDSAGLVRLRNYNGGMDIASAYAIVARDVRMSIAEVREKLGVKSAAHLLTKPKPRGKAKVRGEANKELRAARLMATYEILLSESDLANPQLTNEERMSRAIHLRNTYDRLHKLDPSFSDDSEQLALARKLLNGRAYQRRKAAKLAA